MENEKQVKTVTALSIPVQVFILFMVQNKKDFTVADAITEFETMHKILLPEARMRQILNELVLSDNLTMDMKANGLKNKRTAFYTFKKLI
ncbi:MAG: hypothetical protein V4721_16485 [Bacteroidota bacterium]